MRGCRLAEGAAAAAGIQRCDHACDTSSGHSLASPTPSRSEMARDFARVSAMDGMMWLGLVHCRRSFLQQKNMGFQKERDVSRRFVLCGC
jgi:hypothetical protein